MINDPIVNEIHEIRRQLLAECDGDLDKLLDRYQATEDPNRIVTLQDVKERRGSARQRRQKTS